MREIIFRGKRRQDNMWLQGDFYCDCASQCAYINGVEVDLTTVGQYTGLMDGNRKKIFEGDIIDDNFVGVGRVGFSNGSYEICYPNEVRKWFIDFLDSEMKCVFVIGNIYDYDDNVKEMLYDN